jgi:hypothetical protein
MAVRVGTGSTVGEEMTVAVAARGVSCAPGLEPPAGLCAVVEALVQWRLR